MTGHRYVTPSGPEAEYEPGSRGLVLRNLKGIRRKREMDAEEFDTLVHAQEAWLSRVGPDTAFTAALICKMHADWLGSLYAWAGHYRTVELAKPGFMWPPAYLVERNMLTMEQETLAKLTPCRPGPLGRIADDLARVHSELLLIHPFREGNGRLARWLAELMALQAGLPLPAYRFTGRGSEVERKRYLAAVQRGYVEDYRPLADFFADALTRGRA